jgi:hypothetical protein
LGENRKWKLYCSSSIPCHYTVRLSPFMSFKNLLYFYMYTCSNSFKRPLSNTETSLGQNFLFGSATTVLEILYSWYAAGNYNIVLSKTQHFFLSFSIPSTSLRLYIYTTKP